MSNRSAIAATIIVAAVIVIAISVIPSVSRHAFYGMPWYYPILGFAVAFLTRLADPLIFLPLAIVVAVGRRWLTAATIMVGLFVVTCAITIVIGVGTAYAPPFASAVRR